MRSPHIVQIIRARAPYLKALQDAFAASFPAGARFSILWPEHDTAVSADCLPAGDNIEVVSIACRSVSSHRWHRWPQEAVASRLPSRALWQALQARQPDLIWIHEYSPYTLTGLVYAKWQRIPVVVSSEIGRDNAACFRWTVRLWHRFWGHFVDGFIACCPAARRPLATTSAPCIDAFHAVDSRVFAPAVHPPSNSAVTFVFLGHLIPRKGLDLLFAAAARLKVQTQLPFRLRVIGGGDTAALRQAAAQEGVAENLELTGFLSGEALREAVRSSDVFVLPTRQDTYAAVVHEAACLGLPLLVSKYAGAAEALIGGTRSGFIIDPFDADDFARHMLALFDGPTRAIMRTAARQRADELSAHQRGPALWQWMEQNSFAAVAPTNSTPVLA